MYCVIIDVCVCVYPEFSFLCSPAGFLLLVDSHIQNQVSDCFSLK